MLVKGEKLAELLTIEQVYCNQSPTGLRHNHVIKSPLSLSTWVYLPLPGTTGTVKTDTAGIISLLTHICICVVLNTLVHAQLTYGHQSPCH